MSKHEDYIGKLTSEETGDLFSTILEYVDNDQIVHGLTSLDDGDVFLIADRLNEYLKGMKKR